MSKLVDRSRTGYSKCLDEVRATWQYVALRLFLLLTSVPPWYDHVRDIRIEKACAFVWSSGPSDPIVNILYIVVCAAPLDPPISISFTDNRFFRENGKLSLWPFQDTIL